MPKLSYSRSNSKSKKPEKIGKGKVTPVQIAFIVDRYLLDNNFIQTRSTFRSEADNLISKSPVQEAPKSLLSLGAMLDEYISLKEQKVGLNQEWCRMEQEKFRVQNLLKGLQDAMNAFNATAQSVTPPPPPPPHPINSSGVMSPNIYNELPIGSPQGYYSAYHSPAVMPAFQPPNYGGDSFSVLSQTTNNAFLKRKASRDVFEASLTTKRSHRCSNTPSHLLPKDASVNSQPGSADNHLLISREHSANQTLVHANVSGGQMADGSHSVQSSNVVKCLFTKPIHSLINLSDPRTPPQPSLSQAEKSASPVELCSTLISHKDTTPQQITSTNSTIISSQTIRVSPAKQMSYHSIARNQHISTSSPVKVHLKKPSKRDHVKGRLDFDAPEMRTSPEKPVSNEISTSQCDKEVDILGLDLESLEALGNINISELLVDFDMADQGASYSSEPAYSSPDSISWSPQKMVKVNIGANQVFSQISSTVTEVVSQRDATLSGPDSFATVKSVTKTVQILSPAKSQRSSLDHEDAPVQDKLD